MNNEIWTDETAKRWGSCVAIMRQHERKTRLMRRANGCLAVFYLTLALAQLLLSPAEWMAPTENVLIGWLMYRLHLSSCKREQFWRNAIHHGQRMLVETPERAAWHSKELDILMTFMR